MPANHVALLGQQKKVLAGYSQSSTLPHTGFIYYSDLVQKLPPVRYISLGIVNPLVNINKLKLIVKTTLINQTVQLTGFKAKSCTGCWF